MRRVFWILLTCLVLVPVLLLGGWLALAPAPPLLDGVGFSPLVLDREGNLLRLGLTEDDKYRVRVRLHEVSAEAVRAVLLYEDRYFYRHPGVNPLALLRAVVSMLGGARRMGGSTITMQVARLRLGLSTDSVAGKLRQMGLALLYERHYSKEALLEAYFNLAPYGGNIEGIGAAARIYFHTTPGRLTRSESLALAVVPQNPIRRSPLNGRDFMEARSRMQRLAALADRESGDISGLDKPDLLTPLRVYGPADLPFDAPHLTSELLPLSQEGLPVRTYLDPAAQQLLERTIEKFAARGRRYGLHNAAALLVHWPSMEVRALAGSASFFQADIAGQVDGTRARRSPGSTLKPFVYALALEQGMIHPQSVLPDSPGHYGAYHPENFDRVFRGPIPAHVALRASRNLPAIRLASQLQPDLYSFLRRAGVQLPFEREHYGLSLVLGGAEVSMRELGALYAMLANKGVLRPLRFHEGEPRAAGRSLLSPEAAIVTLRMLEDDARTVHTRRGAIPLRIKTGTSNGFRDAWTAGVFGPYVLVVWAGNFDNAPNPLLTGGEVAAPLFRDIAQALALREDLEDWIPLQQKGLNITRERVCTATGDLDTSLCTDTTETWYIPGRSPTRSSGVFRTILINRQTGLRACMPVPGQTEERVWEFWPSDLAELFSQAGVIKAPPPPFEESCKRLTPPGRPPSIITPREGVIYQRRLSDPVRNGIPLEASLDADARAVFWFVQDAFIGRSLPGKPLLWYPPGGQYELRAVDDLGRVAMRRVVVRTLP